jgi:hypothetical protein
LNPKKLAQSIASAPESVAMVIFSSAFIAAAEKLLHHRTTPLLQKTICGAQLGHHSRKPIQIQK